MGSITNLYATPVTGLEFLLGKQLPYAALAFASFASLLLLGLGLFQVPVKGSLAALVVGATLYVVATTGFGLLLSTFVKTQVAAIFAAGILTTLPAMQFSGFLKPTSSLSGSARVMGQVFPSTYFQQISIGAFTKALSFADLDERGADLRHQVERRGDGGAGACERGGKRVHHLVGCHEQ